MRWTSGSSPDTLKASRPKTEVQVADPMWSCRHCRYWLPIRAGSIIETDPNKATLGECRRHAPRPEAKAQGPASWPQTEAGDRCGEYAERA